MARYTSLAINNPADLLFGQAPRPLSTRRGMVIGGGTVYPEINFTLPNMLVERDTMDTVAGQYEQMIHGVLSRFADLHAPGVVVEFETVPPMTEFPDWGMRLVTIMLEAMEHYHREHGLKSVFRLTPNDNREFIRPPVMRSGRYWDAMVELFERGAAAGCELLSIESVGGKEVHDEALTMGDLPAVIFALGSMGVRDMRFLWTKIHGIAQRYGVHAAGDTACGFANTAMVLAEQRMIPRVFAAVVRAVSAVRSLVAYECGAVGPGKDCGYENIFLKAITGCPMAHEGKSSSCAHLSPVGNVAAVACDTWSNESVQNVKLLGGMAPVCMAESLAYDCRLMNQAAADGPAARRQLARWLARSDAALDPQAFILSPESAIAVARAIVEAKDAYHASRSAALTAIDLMEQAMNEQRLLIAEREKSWLPMMRQSVEDLPDDESAFVSQMMATVDTSKFVAADYELH